MNPFQDTFHGRLCAWRTLRTQSATLTSPHNWVEIDRWWSQAPLVNHYLHPGDQENWPNPWDLLSENCYCLLTRALGIVYTVYLIYELESTIFLVSDSWAEEHYLVQPGGVKYLLNYHPGTVLSNTLDQFTVRKSLTTSSVLQKLR